MSDTATVTKPDFDVDANVGMLPLGIAPQAGLLTDGEIEAALDQGYLFAPKTAKRANIRYASYQLRIGTGIWFLSRRVNEKGEEQESWEQFPFEEGQFFQINPGATAKIFSAEKANIPLNVMAHAIPVGNLYELGLVAEVTYADPGYMGDFWVIVCNYSSRVVELKVGARLARMEFTKLNQKPKNTHPGQGGVKKPDKQPYRLRKKSPDELGALELKAILQDVSSRVDPPHYEHAFVTERVKASVENELGLLKSEDMNLSKKLSIMKIPLYFSLAVCAVFLWGKLGPYLPAGLTKKITDGVFGVVMAILALIFAAIQKDIRGAVKQIFQGKES